MKNLNVIAFLTFTAALACSAQASRKTVPTLITCMQSGVVVGIDHNLEAYTVATGDRPAQLVATQKVSKSIENGETVYENSYGTLILRVSIKPNSITGSFSLLRDGPSSIIRDNVSCTENYSITYND